RRRRATVPPRPRSWRRAVPSRRGRPRRLRPRVLSVSGPPVEDTPVRLVGTVFPWRIRLVSTRVVLRALLPFLLHALAREVDAACGLMLHTSLDVPGFVATALRLIDPTALLARAAVALAAGTLVWLAAAAWRRRGDGGSLEDALRATAGAFAPLYLRPAL